MSRTAERNRRSVEDRAGCCTGRGYHFHYSFIFKLRETIVNAIPENLKYGITSGIGLFIAFVGLKGAGVVVSDDSTLVALGNFGRPEVALC